MRTFNKQSEQFENPLGAENKKGWTVIRNYGKGKSTLKIHYGKKLGKLYQRNLVKIKGRIECEECDEDIDFELIVNAQNLMEILRYA